MGKLLQSFEWNHLSNIIFAYDNNCIKQFVEKRSATVIKPTVSANGDLVITPQPTAITASIASSVSLFFQSLPAFCSLSRSTRTFLCKANIRPLIFPNVHELNQSCFAEPWQVIWIERGNRMNYLFLFF